jgi:uncharacterized protein YndB with AHSA1/START domain
MHIPVSPETVFNALDSDEGRASFWADSAVETEAGIRFCFSNGFHYLSKVIERRPPSLFVLDYFDATARFEIQSDGSGGTDLFLTHEGVSVNHWQEVHAGWLNVLFPLKAWLVHGVDLRNHDPQRSWERGYADQ